MIFSTIILSICSAFLYRMGGYFQTKIRDFGVPSCVILWFLINNYYNLILIPIFFLIFLSQTSYFKKKGTDAKWYNWIFVGLAFSLSLIPIPIISGNWLGFIYRTLLVTIFTTIWSESISNDVVEESGRGFVQIATLPLLLT